MKPTIRALAALNTRLGWLFCSGAWILLAVMTGVVVTSVFYRYVLNDSLTWAEDVSLMMMIWMAFLVAPTAYRQSANVSLDTFRVMLRGRLAQAMSLLIHVVLVALFIVFISETLELIGRSRIRANTVPVPMKYIYMVMPAAFVAMVLVGLELIARCLVGLHSPNAVEAQAPGTVPNSEVPQA